MDNLNESLNRAERTNNALPFYALILFTFFVYITPQAYFSELEPLRLPRICALFALATYFLNCFQGKSRAFRWDRETLFLVIIILCAIISIPFSIWPGGSLRTFVNLYIKSILIFFLISNVANSVKRLKVFLWFIISFCAFLASVGIQDYYSGNFWQLDRIQGAGWGIAANPNDLALTLSLSMPYAMSFYLLYRNKLRRHLAAGYIIIATIGVFCTFSRAGLLTVVLAHGFFLAKNIKRRRFKILLLGIIFMFFFFSFVPESYIERMSSIFDFQKDTTGSALSRIESTSAGFAIMLENPILGVGLGMNILALNERGFFWDRIHNVYLEIGSEIGIPAMIIFVVFLYTLIRSMRSIQRRFSDSGENSEFGILAEGIEISLWTFSFAAFFYPVAYHFYFYYLAGSALALKRISDQIDSRIRGNNWHYGIK